MELKEYKLDEIAQIYNHKRVPLNSRERRPGRYPYYGASGIVDFVENYLFEGDHVLISEDGENLRSRNTPIAFKVSGKFWVNNHAHIIKGNEDFLNDYLVYYFQNLDINPFITGAVQPKLNKENLLSIPIFLPDFEIAKRNTAILTALDDKIELNRRMNETLEGIAQAIWEEWFGKYANGEEELPEGWRWGKLGEISSNRKEQIRPYEMSDGHFYVGLEHMSRKSLSLPNWDTAEELASNKFKFSKGDLLFGKLRPYFHKVCIAPIDGVCSTDILVINPKQKFWYAFMAFHFFSEELVTFSNKSAGGTRMPRTNWNDLANFEIAIPTPEIASQFNELIKPFLDAAVENIHESRNLSKIRDTILPKLIKGEVFK